MNHLPKLENCAYFDGNNYIFARKFNYIPSGSFSICFWVRWGEVAPGGDMQPTGTKPKTATLISYDESGEDGTGPHSFQIQDVTDLTIAIAGNIARTGISIADMKWHHVAFCINKTGDGKFEVSSYLDGNGVGSIKKLSLDPNDGPIPNGDLLIGQKKKGNHSDAFSGQICFLNINSAIMSNNDIEEAKNNGRWRGDKMCWTLNNSTPGTQAPDMIWRETGVELPKPGEHIITVDTSSANNREVFLLGENQPKLGKLFTPGKYVISIDGLGTIPVDIDKNRVLLNGQDWRGVGPLHIEVRENDAYFYTNEPRIDGHIELVPQAIPSRSVLVEDHDPITLEIIKVYRTSVTIPYGIKAVKIKSSIEVEATINGFTKTLTNGKSTIVEPNYLSKLIITIPAKKIGTPELHISYDGMARGAFAKICPDVAVHRKMNVLDNDAIFNERHRLKLKDGIDKESCNAVQTSVQNLSKAVEHSYIQSAGGTYHHKRLTPGRMKDTHWKLDFSNSGHNYTALKKEEVVAHTKGAVRKNIGVAKNIFEDIGSAFVDAGKVVVHTVEKVGEDIVDTSETLWNDTTQTLEKMGDDIVRGDFRGTLNDFVSGVEDEGGDLINGVQQVQGDIREGAEEVLVITIHTATEIAQYVLDHTGIIGNIIKGLLDTIELIVDEFIDWLADILGWNEVIKTQKLLADMISSNLNALPIFLNKIENELINNIDILASKIENPIDSIIADLEKHIKPKADRGHSSIIERLDWLLSKLDLVPHSEIATTYDIPPRIKVNEDNVIDFTNLENSLNAITNDPKLRASIKDSFEQISAFVEDPSQSPKSLLIAILKLGDFLVELLKDCLEALIKAIFELVKFFIEFIGNIIKYEFNILFVSSLFSKISHGEKLNLLNLSTLLLAIPVTEIARLNNVSIDESFFKKVIHNKKTTSENNQIIIGSGTLILDGIVSSYLDANYNYLEFWGANIFKNKRYAAEIPKTIKAGSEPPSFVTAFGFISILNNMASLCSSSPYWIKDSEKIKITEGISWGYQFVPFLLDMVSIGCSSLNDKNKALLAKYTYKKRGLAANFVFEAINIILNVTIVIEEAFDKNEEVSYDSVVEIIPPLKGIIQSVLLSFYEEQPEVILPTVAITDFYLGMLNGGLNIFKLTTDSQAE